MNLGQEILNKFEDKKIDSFKFCQLVKEEHEGILKSSVGVKAIREKKRGFKEFVEEIIPISFYIRKKWALDKKLFVTWCGSKKGLDGSTIRYDGLVDQVGIAVDIGNFEPKFYLEVTSAILKNQHLADQLLNEEGGHFAVKGISKQRDGKVISEVISFNDTEYVDEFCERLFDIIVTKLTKEYPDKTVLIVCCTMDILYTSNDWKLLESKIRNKIINDKFIEIFIYDSTAEHFFTIIKANHY